MCVVSAQWWCQLMVMRTLFCQENSYYGSGCLHVGAPAALGSRVLSKGVSKGVGAVGTGFAKPQRARGCTQGRLRMSINTHHCMGRGAGC